MKSNLTLSVTKIHCYQFSSTDCPTDSDGHDTERLCTTKINNDAANEPGVADVDEEAGGIGNVADGRELRDTSGPHVFFLRAALRVLCFQGVIRVIDVNGTANLMDEMRRCYRIVVVVEKMEFSDGRQSSWEIGLRFQLSSPVLEKWPLGKLDLHFNDNIIYKKGHNGAKQTEDEAPSEQYTSLHFS
uniref:DUF4283 domain-containing protein n=1 Tax=Setaria digitata TaxID=48799 RepID=A0A915PB52_9BILA